MSNKKLTKEIVFNAFGKEKSSPEFQAILEILGEPVIEPDIESNLIDLSWYHYGIDIVLSYDTEIFYNIFFYPNGTKTDKEYLTDRKICQFICQENDFDQNLTMQDVRKRYGEPDREQETYGGYELLYHNHNNLKYYFTFVNETQVYSIMIGWRE